MRENPCILIIYATFGDGHVQAAESIRQSFAALGIRRVHLVDLFAEAHPNLNAISRKTYLLSSAYFPRLYGFSYDVTNRTRPDPMYSRLFHSVGRRKLREIVDRLKPDAVIHTFPYLAMAELSERLSLGIPTFTVLTDYVLHSRWVHPDTDRYYVATEGLKKSLAASGIADDRIAVSGIPIRGVFSRRLDRETACSELGLDPARKYALVSAGAYGVQGHLNKMVRTLLEHSDCDVLLVCGKNRNLLRKMETAFAGEPRVHAMGFVERMEAWMAIAWCLITKAGAMTLTEAISQALPVIVYRPLPGQERGNAQVLSDLGAVLTARHSGELRECLRTLHSQKARTKLTDAMSGLHVPGSSDRIASDILRKLSAVKHPHADWERRTAAQAVSLSRTN